MSHDVHHNDNLVMHRTPAWHRLGITVEDAPTPIEGFERAGLLYDVDQYPVYSRIGDREVEIPDRLANIRSDDNSVLGIVSPGYQVIQNRTLAEFCELLAEGDDLVTCESLGTLSGGRKVWCLIKGESFSVRGDEVCPYYCISNGHDGVTGMRGDPTTIRVQCANTLRMVVGDVNEPKAAGFSFRHVGDVRARIDEAKAALGLYGAALEKTREVTLELAAKAAPRKEDLVRFFRGAYELNFGAVPDTPADETARRVAEKWNKALDDISKIWRLEENIGGPNMWSALNAYTGWLQHVRPRMKAERRAHANLLGINSERTHQALQLALAV